MAERLKIFVGKNDSEELSCLGQESKKEGYETNSFLERLKQMVPIIVSIRGGLTEYCVADTAKIALHLGATGIEIDLHRCRATSLDQGYGDEETIKCRRKTLKRGLGMWLAEDSRISITPLEKDRRLTKIYGTALNALYRRFT